MKSLTQSNRNILVLTIVLCGLVAYSFIDAQTWTPPSAKPPAGNASAPINVSTDAQTKAGDLTVVNLTSGNVINAANSVSAPTLNTTNVWASNLLHGPNIQGGDIFSWGRVRSDQYCDQNGLNCIAPWNIQPKVTGTCSTGQAIRQVNADGSVVCSNVAVPAVPSCSVKTDTKCMNGWGSPSCPGGYTEMGRLGGASCNNNGDRFETVTCIKCS